jgi:inosine/xanthosine triphosphatase
MLITVGSTNPVKLGAVTAIVRQVWPDAEVATAAVPSGVPDQPWGDEEIRRGAYNRARAALETKSADLGIGLEGGLVETAWGVATLGWVVAYAPDRVGLGVAGGVLLPTSVVDLIRGGLELGAAMDRLTGVADIKRGPGAIGVLTAGLSDRTSGYAAAVACALSPFLTPHLYANS